jgi:hypothetical protein
MVQNGIKKKRKAWCIFLIALHRVEETCTQEFPTGPDQELEWHYYGAKETDINLEASLDDALFIREVSRRM